MTGTRSVVAEPHRNRVTPLGDIVAMPLRCGWMGNRGILHQGKEIVAFHRGDLWITCALRYRDWRAAQWAPRHYTVLFFHDEAVALAAGHRPCALCRREAYRAFSAAVAAASEGQPPSARVLDRTLHAERLIRGTHRRRLHTLQWSGLPTGTFVLLDDGPAVILRDALVPWTSRGYGRACPRPSQGQVRVITPPASVAALTAGYPVQIDRTASPDR